MRIGPKLVLSLAFPIVLLIALFAYLDQQRSRTLLREELAREGRAVARAIELSIEDSLRDRQLEDMKQLVDNISGYERILGVRVFDRSGRIIYQSSSLEAQPFIQASVLQDVLATGRQSSARREVGVEPVVAIFCPLRDTGDRLVGAIQVLQLESFIEEDAASSRNAIGVLAALLILAAGGVILVVVRSSVSRPVGELLERFHEVGRGDLDARVPVRSRGELGRLAEEFNRMCELLQAARQSLLLGHEERRRLEASMRQTEHLASLGRLAAGLAHEIGTPLGIINSATESMTREGRRSARDERNLRFISEELARIEKIVRGMLDFGRMPKTEARPVSIASIIDRVMTLLEFRLQATDVKVETSLPPDLPVVAGDGERLQQVFLNLAMNAVDAMNGGGLLRLTAMEEQAVPPDDAGGPLTRCLVVRVADSGIGIPRENLRRLFEPFFTTKEVGQGTGLGLSVAYGIVREHGGWLVVDSNPGKGTIASVYLPVTATDAPRVFPAEAA